uniref:CP n=1 Tax=Avocado citrivirus 1 TaxID=2794431 RepID=A0A7T5QZ53_9VIRU|nr:CP [Avocado citrivirus 1]
MSIKLKMRDMVRKGLKEYLWNSFVDPENTLGLRELAQDNTVVQLNDDQRLDKLAISMYYMKLYFGNIADMGASLQTEFPSMTMEVRPMQLPHPIGERREWRSDFNLRTLAESIKTWGRANTDPTIRTLSFRKLCEPFADEALGYYLDNHERASNLYEKMPEICLAREVSFDFASGLSEINLAQFPLRKRTIQSLNSRLFHSQGKQMEFTARGTITQSTLLEL